MCTAHKDPCADLQERKDPSFTILPGGNCCCVIGMYGLDGNEGPTSRASERENSGRSGEKKGGVDGWRRD